MASKEKRLSTRVSDKLYEKLTAYSEEKKISFSKIIRNALIYYLRFTFDNVKIDNPIKMFSKSELEFMFSRLSGDADCEKLAEICYENGVRTRDYYLKDFIQEKPSLKARLILSSLNETVFSINGQNWFEEVSYRFEGNRFIFAGNHAMNVNYSKFIKFFMIKHLAEDDYELREETLQEGKVLLIFEKNATKKE